MSNDENKTVYKMVIIWERAVGKTWIFKKITYGGFNEISISTIGIDRRTLTFKINTSDGEKEVDVQLWDTAGQERYRSLTTKYYKSSQGLLLIYDITNKESFDNLDIWLKIINESLGESNNYLVVLLGNKVDLVNNDPEKRQISTEDA